MNIPSSLTVIPIASIVMALALLATSSMFLDISLRIKKNDGCGLDLDDILGVSCKGAMNNWIVAAATGIAVSVIQGVSAVFTRKVMVYNWKIWMVIQGLIFFFILFAFSWGAKHGVDDKIYDRLILLITGKDFNSDQKGAVFLAFAGLDFLFLLLTTLYVFYFERKSSALNS